MQPHHPLPPFRAQDASFDHQPGRISLHLSLKTFVAQDFYEEVPPLFSALASFALQLPWPFVTLHGLAPEHYKVPVRGTIRQRDPADITPPPPAVQPQHTLLVWEGGELLPVRSPRPQYRLPEPWDTPSLPLLARSPRKNKKLELTA